MIKLTIIKSLVGSLLGKTGSKLAPYLRVVAPYAVVGLFCFGIGYWIAGKSTTIEQRPEQRFLSPDMFGTRVPNFRSVPTIQFVHTERTRTRVDTIRVPHDFEYTGVVERRPLTVTSRRVYLNYYDTVSGQMITDRYDVPGRRFRFDYGAEGGLVPVAWDRAYLGVFAEARYRRLAINGTVRYLIDENELLPTVGMKIYF